MFQSFCGYKTSVGKKIKTNGTKYEICIVFKGKVLVLGGGGTPKYDKSGGWLNKISSCDI